MELQTASATRDAPIHKTTINSLPPELIHHIIDLASKAPYLRAPSSFPLTAALVCRSWRSAAQDRLWQYVSIRSTGTARSFVASSGRGRRRTSTLVLNGDGSLDAGEVGRIVGACVGLRRLYLPGLADVDSAFLSGEELSGLQKLSLVNTSFLPALPSTPPPSFSLEALAFHRSFAPNDFTLPDPLLAVPTALFQPSPSITSLTFALAGTEPSFGVFNFTTGFFLTILLPLAPHLISLLIPITRATTRFLSACTRLQTLTMVGSTDSTLECMTETQESVSQALKYGGAGVASLRRLELVSHPAEDYDASWRAELAKECERRGCELVFQVEVVRTG